MELFPIYDQNSAISPNLWYSVSGVGESPSMRVGHTILHHNDDESKKGKLYIVGGANPSGSFNEVYVFDMDNLGWDKFDEMTTGETFDKGRYEHASFSMIQDGRFLVYIFGGSNEDGSLNDILEFDFNEKKCSRVKPENTSVPSPRTCHVGATYKNQLVIYGGGESGKMAVSDAKLYIYNPKTRKWAALSIQGATDESPASRHGHLMITGGDDSIYLHGGMSDDRIFDDLWKIDMKKLSWSLIKSERSRPCARAAHGGVSVNSSLYVFGGLSQTGLALDDLWKFDTESNQWTSIEIFGHRPPCRLDFAYCKMKFKLSDDEQNGKDAEFMVIHGGMDTEGNVFDDLFFIHLT